VELFVVELVQKRDVPFRLRVHPAFFFELVNRQEGTTGARAGDSSARVGASSSTKLLTSRNGE
jgi:hypothetical protein